MKIKRSVIIITILAILTITIYSILKPSNYKIYFDQIDNESINAIRDSIVEKNPKIKIDILDQYEPDSKVDLVLSYNREFLVDISEDLRVLDIKNINMLPSSIRNLQMIGSESKVIPLQLDHIEIAVKKTLIKDEDITLDKLIEQLKEIRTSIVYPIMISGKNNSSLFDAISLLTVTFSGTEGLKELYRLIYNEENDINNYIDIPLNNKSSLKDILDIFISWKRERILHPEWLSFSSKDVMEFVKHDLTGAVIQRLSEHRAYPTEIISKYSAIQFPNNSNGVYAPDILCIPLYAASVNRGKNSNLTTEILNSLLEEQLQKKLTFSSGVAPVNSKVVTMDIQAADVRYWAASSNSIASLIPYTDDKIDIFISKIREYLIQNN